MCVCFFFFFILGYGIFRNFGIWDIGIYFGIRVKLILGYGIYWTVYFGIWDIAYPHNQASLLDPLDAVKHSKRKDGPYCTVSGNAPSSVTLYKTGSESQTFLLQFKEFSSV